MYEMSNENEKANDTTVEETEVLERPRRRRFTAEYKLRVLGLADACTVAGEIGALMRREGIYSSHLTEWRKARRAGLLSALGPKKRGPAPMRRDERDAKIAQLESENERLNLRAERAEALIELQKKVAELLGRDLTGKSGKR